MPRSRRPQSSQRCSSHVSPPCGWCAATCSCTRSGGRRSYPQGRAGIERDASAPAARDLRAVAELLVPQAVGGAVEPVEIQRARLRAARIAFHYDAVAGAERIRRNADLGELPAVVHLQPPRLARPVLRSDLDDEERMRIHEVKLGDRTLEGEIAEFHFVNPHPFLVVEVTAEDGARESWRLEMDNRRELAEIGITSDTFRAGDRVVVEGNAGRTEPRTLYLYRLDRAADGLRYEQLGYSPKITRRGR